MMSSCATSSLRNQGFSLIEAALVTLIAGLLIGGILIGGMVIKNAELRQLISQKQQFDSAVNNFESKYGVLPGDISVEHASQRGLFTLDATIAKFQGYADENGIINTWGNNDDCCVGEGLTFWRHLSEAGLIEGYYGRSSSNPLDSLGRATVATTNPDLFLPRVKLHNFSMLVIGAGSTDFGFQRYAKSHNYYYFRQVTQIPNGNFMSYNWVTFSPIEAYTIDKKIDDGMPNTGKIVNGKETSTDSNANWNTTPADGNCTYGGSGTNISADVLYNVDSNNGGNSSDFTDPDWGTEKYICDIYIEFE